MAAPHKGRNRPLTSGERSCYLTIVSASFTIAAAAPEAYNPLTPAEEDLIHRACERIVAKFGDAGPAIINAFALAALGCKISVDRERGEVTITAPSDIDNTG